MLQDPMLSMGLPRSHDYSGIQSYNNMTSNISGVHTNISPFVDQIKRENPFNDMTVLREPTSKSYYKWVANKRLGVLSRWSGKLMVPLCQRPFVGIILLLLMFIMIFFLTRYIYSFRCSIRQLSELERKTVTDLIIKDEITKLNTIINTISSKSSFTGRHANEDMVYEQAMYQNFTDAEKSVYIKVSNDDKRLIFKNYLKSLK